MEKKINNHYLETWQFWNESSPLFAAESFIPEKDFKPHNRSRIFIMSKIILIFDAWKKSVKLSNKQALDFDGTYTYYIVLPAINIVGYYF